MKKLLLAIFLISNITTLSCALSDDIKTEMQNKINKKIEKARNMQYQTITSPYTGKVWLDRNLGAKRVCQSFSDTQCYGDYYKFSEDGRNICPNGFRIPTKDELVLETRNQGYSYKRNFLKLPAAGRRYSDGSMSFQGSRGYIWSSNAKGKSASYLFFSSRGANWSFSFHSIGRSVRCLKD